MNIQWLPTASSKKQVEMGKMNGCFGHGFIDLGLYLILKNGNLKF